MTTEEQRAADQHQNHVDDMWNKLMIAAVIGLLSWNLYTTQQLTVDIAVLQEKIEQLEEKLK